MSRVGVPGWFVTYEVELADGVDSPASSAVAWRMSVASDLEASASELAAYLGLGPVGPYPGGDGLFAEDGEGASLWVSPQGDWFFSGSYDMWPEWDCPDMAYGDVDVDVSADGWEDVARLLLPPCEPPPPSSGVPSDAEARRLASDLIGRFASAPLSAGSVSSDSWGAFFDAELLLPDGSPSGMPVSVGFAGEGRLAWASASFAGFEEVGTYPLVGVEVAVQRLRDELLSWGDMGAGYVWDDVYAVPGVVDGVAEPYEGVTSEFEEYVVEPLLVRIVSAQLAYLPVWSAEDEVLMLPHFRLVDADGAWWFAMAIEDRFLAF